MTDFTGDYSANSAGMDPTAFNVTAAANIHNIGITQTEPLNMPTEAELADVHFTPTMIPSLNAATQMSGGIYGQHFPRYSRG